ncbi:MAG: hypothetical protein IJ445_03630 [Clostridia bacterium]|nr:hypothetical protein [Clostridia bacterium]
MKKNKFMRLASVMLMLCLITTCAISGTFAKYTTSDSAQDSARVAKWGLTVVVEGDTAFKDNYEGTAGAGVNTVSTLGGVGDSVIAPGTNGVLSTAKIYGQSEVRTNVKVTVDLSLGDKWTTDGADVYCPLIFTVNGTEYKIDATNDTTAKLEAAVEDAILDIILNTTADYTPNGSGISSANLDHVVNHDFGTEGETDLTVNWRWDFSTSEANDAKDTILGNTTGANIPTVNFSLNIVVDQVD